MASKINKSDMIFEEVKKQGGKIDLLAGEVSGIKSEVSEMKGILKAIPPHSSPCAHDHPAIREKIDNHCEVQKTTEKELRDGIRNNSIFSIGAAAIISGIGAIFSKFGIK